MPQWSRAEPTGNVPSNHCLDSQSQLLALFPLNSPSSLSDATSADTGYPFPPLTALEPLPHSLFVRQMSTAVQLHSPRPAEEEIVYDDEDFDDGMMAAATIPALPQVDYELAFEKTLVAPATAAASATAGIIPPMSRRVSFPNGEEYRLTGLQSPPASVFAQTQPMAAAMGVPGSFIYSSAHGSPLFQGTRQLSFTPPPPDHIPALSLSSLSRSASEQPSFHYQSRPLHFPPSPSPPLRAASAQSASTRANRIQSLLSEFDSKFLQVDERGRASYPEWAVPYAREMRDKLEWVKRLERGEEERRREEDRPDSRAFRRSDEKRASLGSAGKARTRDLTASLDRPMLHKRYDSILDQYYPDKHQTVHGASPAQSKRESSAATAAKKAAAAVPTRRASASSAHSNCVGHSHGKHSTKGTEDEGQRIRVTKLHSAMAEQINLLTGSLKEAWEHIATKEEEDKRRAELDADDRERREREEERRQYEERLRREEDELRRQQPNQAVEEELAYFRQYREWNRARMADIVTALQEVRREQDDGERRVAGIRQEQEELRARYEDAKRRMEEMERAHELKLEQMRREHQHQLQMQQHQQPSRVVVRDNTDGEDRLRRERDEYAERHSSAQQRLNELQQKLQGLELDKASLERQMAQLSNGHGTSQAGLMDQLAALQLSQQQLLAKAVALEQNNAQLANSHSHTTTTLTQLQHTHASLHTQYQSDTALLARCQQELGEAKHALTQIQSLLRVEGGQSLQWREESERLAGLVKEMEAAIAAGEKRGEEKRELTADERLRIVVPRMLCNFYKGKYATAQAEGKRQLSQALSMAEQVKAKQDEIAALQDKQRQLLALQEELHSSLSASTNSSAALSASLSDISKQLQAKKEEVALLQNASQQRISQLESDLTSNQSQLAQADALNKQLQQRTSVLDTLRHELAYTSLTIAGYKGDYLGCRLDKQIMALIKEKGDAFILYADVITRYDSHNNPQPRLLLVTENHLYFLRRHSQQRFSLARLIPLHSLLSLALSPTKGDLLVLHCGDHYDYLLESGKRGEMVWWVWRAYTERMGGAALPVEWKDFMSVRLRGLLHAREVRIGETEKMVIGKRLPVHEASAKGPIASLNQPRPSISAAVGGVAASIIPALAAQAVSAPTVESAPSVAVDEKAASDKAVLALRDEKVNADREVSVKKAEANSASAEEAKLADTTVVHDFEAVEED